MLKAAVDPNQQQQQNQTNENGHPNTLSSQPESVNLHNNMNVKDDGVVQQDAQGEVDFDTGMVDNYNPNNFGEDNNVSLGQAPMLNREQSQSDDDLNGNTDTVYDNNLNDANLDDDGQLNMNQDGQDDDGNGEEEEGESVYMIDGVVMKVIQIEGEDN